MLSCACCPWLEEGRELDCHRHDDDDDDDDDGWLRGIMMMSRRA